MADIFIIFSEKDRAIVARLAAFLEGNRYDVWWDSTQSDCAQSDCAQTRAETMRQLAAARGAIVVWSPNSVASDWVLDQSNEAKRA